MKLESNEPITKRIAPRLSVGATLCVGPKAGTAALSTESFRLAPSVHVTPGVVLGIYPPERSVRVRNSGLWPAGSLKYTPLPPLFVLRCLREAEQVREERCRFVFVFGEDDGVVERDGHGCSLR